MSDPEPQPARKSFSPARLLGIALVCGIVVGSIGVYVSESRSGNETAANCPANDALTKALNAASTGEVAAMQALDRPFDASHIAFKNANDEETTLGAMKGRALLVNLWATWCVPCRAEMPALDELERQAGGPDFAVVPINLDMGDAQKPRDFYAETKLTALPLLRDETMGVFNDLKREGTAFGLPTSLLVDAAGCARAVMSGPAEWASADALRLVDAFKSVPAPGA